MGDAKTAISGRCKHVLSGGLRVLVYYITKTPRRSQVFQAVSDPRRVLVEFCQNEPTTSRVVTVHIPKFSIPPRRFTHDDYPDYCRLAACRRIFVGRSEEQTPELQSRGHLGCRLLLEK